MKFSERIIIADYHREILVKKVLPVALIGSIIWLVSQIFFGFLFTATALNTQYLNFLIAFLIISIIFYGILYKVSKFGDNAFGVMIFFIFSFIVGIFSVPLLIITGYWYVYIYAIISIGIGGTGIFCLIALIFRDKFFARGYFWIQILLGTGLIILLEFILIFTLGIQNWITVLISVLSIVYVFVATMIYTVLFSHELKEEKWQFWTYRILNGMVLGFFGIALVLLIILICILLQADEAPDLGGFIGGGKGYGGAGSRGKTQKDS